MCGYYNNYIHLGKQSTTTYAENDFLYNNIGVKRDINKYTQTHPHCLGH